MDNQNTSMPPMGNGMGDMPRPIDAMGKTGGEHVSIGGIIGTIIIIALIVLGGLYFWGKRIETNQQIQAQLNNQQTETNPEQTAAVEASTIKQVSPSADSATIEAELNATNVSNLGAELQ